MGLRRVLVEVQVRLMPRSRMLHVHRIQRYVQPCTHCGVNHGTSHLGQKESTQAHDWCRVSARAPGGAWASCIVWQCVDGRPYGVSVHSST
jgi:hypothetical protein